MLLGLDLGTGSVKALLMDTSGSILGEGGAAYPIRSPRPGWAETDPLYWWEACIKAVRTAVGEHGADVLALGLSGQMHGVVLSDAAGRPLRPAVLWADTRSSGMLDRYRALDAGLLQVLANPLATGMAGPTLLWLCQNEPEEYRAARWALQPKDWLRLRLTGEALSEPSDASATLLYEPEADGWAEAVIEALGLRGDLLPPLVASGAPAGALSAEAADSLGLPVGVTVAAGAGDTAAALLGSGLLKSGPVQLTVGTGGQIFSTRDNFSPDPNLRTHLYRAATAATAEPVALWYSMAAMQNAGLALVWVRRLLGASWRDVYKEAFSVPPGAGGVTFLPYLSGERTPHLDPEARGAWLGLGLDHERGHLLRAALEGVAFALREGLEALEEAGVEASELRLAGGGTLREPWRKLLSDVLGRPLRPLPDEVAGNASARGAALLAGLTAGVYATAAATLELAPELGPGLPPGNDAAAYDAPYARYKQLYPRLYGRDEPV